MNFKSLIIFFLILTCFCQSYGQIDGHKDRKLAIYFNNNENDENYQADYSSMEQLIAVAGLPAIITSEFVESLDYAMVLFSSPIKEATLNQTERNLLYDYVENGGTVIFSGLLQQKLFDFAGIEETTRTRTQYRIKFDQDYSGKEFRWIDEDLEWEIQLGEEYLDQIFSTYAYQVSDAQILAAFESNHAALTKVERGNGLVYTFGFAFRDLIIRNLLDHDFDANRWYSNHFEASSDVIMLMVRAIFTETIPNTVWLSPAPYNSKSVLLITHDVCSHSAHLFSNDFAQFEFERGISALYNITTHQFIDDINGDNYTSHLPQMKLLMYKGHNIGSHSYGHFPDFHDGNIFALGTKLTSAEAYKPYYSNEEEKTLEGTVYGELGASKILLEKDLNITVDFFRSGHLEVHDKQYNILDELGYRYSSSYTAADLLTGFPFFEQADKNTNGEKLPILEIGITISDIFGSHGEEPIDEFNWKDKAEIWKETTESYANNNAVTCLLVHPNRYYKLDAMEYLLDNISDDIHVMEFTEYCDFWEAKNQINFSSSVEGQTLKIFSDCSQHENSEQFSFVVDNMEEIENIEVYDEFGFLQSVYQKDYYLGTGLVYQKSTDELDIHKSGNSNREEQLEQNYPNPFHNSTHISYQVPENSFVTLTILDLFGRVVDFPVNEEKEKGVYSFEYYGQDLKPGIYIYKLMIQSGNTIYSSTKKMIKN